MRHALLLLLAAGCAHQAQAQASCPPGEPIQWIADWCMLKLQTDDEIAASSCIEEESKQRFASGCAAKRHFKQRLCEAMVRAGTRAGSLEQCVGDPRFMGRTVETGGVGGRR